MIDKSIGFIGAGRMATALAKGFLGAGLTSSDHLAASDPAPAAAEHFQRVTGCRADLSNAEVLASSELVFLAVKPQVVAPILTELARHFTAHHLLVSIAAGVRTSTIAKALGNIHPGPRILRVMPNTPCLVGQSATAFCLGPRATAADAGLIEQLLSAVGSTHRVEENLLDAVTGLSGSGPAFVYTMIEALSDGGVAMGLPREIATALAAQTVKGAAEMVLATHQHPGILKDQVTSPGGTTIAGIQALEAAGVRAGLIGAVQAATLRSIELGKSAEA
jgi:pyrroline-5-carboxylate reductase